ncbi:MAG: hypothetical protein LBC20_11615, partial [Planctomycetaceae bacterium]|nr:hypothetical protein [Planctomycetaceae bacterium]
FTYGRHGWAYYCVVRRESFISVRQQEQVGYRRIVYCLLFIVYCLLFKTFRRNVDYLWSSTGVKIEK